MKFFNKSSKKDRPYSDNNIDDNTSEKDIYDRVFEYFDQNEKERVEQALEQAYKPAQPKPQPKPQPQPIPQPAQHIVPNQMPQSQPQPRPQSIVRETPAAYASPAPAPHMYNTYEVQNTRRIDNAQPKENQQLSNGRLVGCSIIIGKREYQQDAIAVTDLEVRNTFTGKWFAILCDGMGGMSGGEKASALCIKKMMAGFRTQVEDVPMFYKAAIEDADLAVSALTDESGSPLGAGSTLISVCITNSGLYWASVGDSHIYVIRGDEIVRVNAEHNYMMELMEMVKRGEITLEQAQNDRQKDALISYMGIGNVSLMDINTKPLALRHGDYILLCSDGLYRALSDREIHDIVISNGDDMQRAAKMLTDSAMLKNNPYQDNTSVIAVRFQ